MTHMARPRTPRKEKALQGTSRALVEALSLCHDRVVMDRIWDLIQEVEGPGHVVTTRKRLLESNPSTATLQMLASRNILYPLEDFAYSLTTPGFMALADLVGPGPLLDGGPRTCVLMQWLTRSNASMSANQARQLIDTLARPEVLEDLAGTVWNALFVSHKLGHDRASLEPCALHVVSHEPQFRPSAEDCLAWLESASYGHHRHRRAVSGFMLGHVLDNPNIDQARRLASAALSGFRAAIAERDDEMACSSFKDVARMSLNPHRLGQWLKASGAHDDPAIIGMFLGTRAHAAAMQGKLPRLAQGMLERAMPQAPDMNAEQARQMLNEVANIIMPERAKPQGFPSATGPALAKLDLRNQLAWDHVLEWSEGLASQDASAMFMHTYELATATTSERDSYPLRRQAVLMHIQTPCAPVLERSARAPRF